MDDDLEEMSREQLIVHVKDLRRGIRRHRDSTRHELCWHHPALWGLLPEKTDPLPEVPDWPDFIQGCVRYRQSLAEDAERYKREPAASRLKEIHMLGENDAVANLAVKNLDVAAKFYEQTLGLSQVGSEGEEVLVFRSGNTTINVYRSKYAGTNKATAVTWMVGDDVEGVVQALKAKGVKFEHYEMPGMTRQGEVHIGDGMKVAWFKDPDGNILNIVNR